MTMAAVWDSIAQCFAAVLSGSDADRRIAEAQLEQLQLAQEYPVALAQATVRSQIDPQLRQMACMALKKYVTEHWSRGESNFAEPETPEQVKAIVRENLPAGLSDPLKRIRSGVAYVISKIAQSDWPEQWPTLFPLLMNLIQSNSLDGKDGAMRVAEELVKEMSELHLEQLVSQLLPELFRMYTDQTVSITVRVQSLNVVRSALSLAANSEQHMLMRSTITQWVPLISETIKVADVPIALRLAAVQLGACIVKNFSKPHSGEIRSALIGPVWATLCAGSKDYVATVVNGMDETGYDSDGDAIGPTPFVCALLEFISEVSMLRAFRKEVREGLKVLVPQMMLYMQMTDDNLDAWSEDANKFIADDDEDSMTYSVRTACVDLLHILSDEHDEHCVNAVFMAAEQLLEECEAQRGQGVEQWWKGSEAALFCCGHVSERFEELGMNSKMDINKFMRTIYSHHLHSDAPYLQGRALWLAGRFNDALCPDVLKQYMDAAVTALEPRFPAPVRVLAMRAFSKFMDSSTDKNVSLPYLTPVFAQIASLLPHATDDLLTLVLELCVTALAVSPDATATAEPLLGPLIVDIWLRYANDPMVLIIVQEAFQLMAQSPASTALLERALVPLMAVLKAEPDSNMYGIQASAIDMLATLVRHCPAPLPNMLITDAFPVLMSILQRSEDAAALQNGCECLSAFLINGADQIAAVNGIEAIVQFVAKLLQSDSEESAIFIGRLITKLIRKVNLGPVLEPLLCAALNKLSTVKYVLFQQTLVSVFAHLLRLDYTWTMDFISKQPGGLSTLLTAWVDNQKDFSGRYDVNATITALAALVRSADPRLGDIVVKGDRIVSAEEARTIRTRSRAKSMQEQYTQVPVVQKMFRILTEELLTRIGTEQEDTWDDEDDDEEGSWMDAPAATTGSKRSVFAPAEDYAYLSELVETGVALDGDDDDDAFEDPEIRSDPIYNTDLKVFLTDFMHAIHRENSAQFDALFQTLPEDEREMLRETLTQ